jgi:hypothetical protein
MIYSMLIREMNNMRSFVLQAVMTSLEKITYDDFLKLNFNIFQKKSWHCLGCLLQHSCHRD